nr:MAG TPA: hypothetical protein [Bacteriophage sp.]
MICLSDKLFPCEHIITHFRSIVKHFVLTL